MQGIPRHTRPPQNIVSLFGEAERIFREYAEPAGIVADISNSEFTEVYKGESRNEKRAPVAEISERADYLVLFAVTIGQAIHDKINELFEHEELTLDIMLDAVASAAAEMATDKASRNRHHTFGKFSDDTPEIHFWCIIEDDYPFCSQCKTRIPVSRE